MNGTPERNPGRYGEKFDVVSSQQPPTSAAAPPPRPRVDGQDAEERGTADGENQISNSDIERGQPNDGAVGWKGWITGWVAGATTAEKNPSEQVGDEVRDEGGGNGQEHPPPIPAPTGSERVVSFEKEGDEEEKRTINKEDAPEQQETWESEPPEPTELYLEHYFRDHFTLSTPSSLVRFRSEHTAARVFENKTSQFILEEQIDEVSKRRRIHVKLLSDGTTGLQFLRGLYTVMCVFWTGIFFVLCLQIMLIMVLELAIQYGETGINPDLDPFNFIGVILGIFVFSYGFALGMVIAGAFVSDAWTGHTLVKLFFFKNRHGSVLVDWVFFCFFVLFPLLVMCITLLMKRDDWWSITLLFWYGCVSLFFVIFATNSVFFEVQGAVSFLSKRPDLMGKGFWRCVKEGLLLKQTAAYSGYRTCKYLARSAALTEDVDHSFREGTILDWSLEERTGPWSKITKWKFVSTASSKSLPFFSAVDPPQRLFTIDDVQDYRPYVTKYTWSLERLFCRPRNSRYIVIVAGPGALTKEQIRSSLVCSILGISVFFLLILSMLVWLEFGAALITVVMVIFGLLSLPLWKDLRRLVKVTTRIFAARDEQKRQQQLPTTQDESLLYATPDPRLPQSRRLSRRESELSDEPNEGMFLVAQQERVTKASEMLCWIAFGLEILLFFIYPLVVLIILQNYQLVVLFVIVAGVSAVRYYISLVTIVEETGQLSLVSGATAKIRWGKQSRLNELIEAISYNKTRQIWQLVLAGCGLFWLVLSLGASGQSTDSTFEGSLTFVNGYSWAPQPEDVRYPTCDLSKSSTFGVNATLADFAFLTTLSYKTDALATSQLTGWFQGVDVVEDRETVLEYRKQNNVDSSPAFFRLYRFRLGNGLDRGVVSIRGTQKLWDVLADFQLWSTTMLCQGLRAILPIGEMWTPILDQIVAMISFFQRGSVEKVSFYKVTTPFAEQLKNDPTFDSIQLTGHSLGGGLAMISGAQSRVPAVALSGPNAMLSGRSFDPIVTPDQLNQYTLNIIPDRDLVPRFDDRAKNFQNIRCLAPLHAVAECHSFFRSFCEIVYTCGNKDRPAVCECVYEYGYDLPVADPNEERSFAQACEEMGYEVKS